MSYSSDREMPGFITFILGIIGLYLLYLLVMLMAKVFVYTGYNSFFFMDNLLRIGSFNPVVSWGILGVLLGSCVGVLAAIKKYKLPGVLVLYPLGGLVLFITIMAFVNKPAQYDTGDNYFPPSSSALPSSTQGVQTSDTSLTSTAVSAPHSRYLYRTEGSTRVHMSVGSPYVLFTIRKGIEVEILKRRFYDATHTEWMLIGYNGREGYVSSRSLGFSRTAYY